MRRLLAALACTVGALVISLAAGAAVAPVRWCGADEGTSDRLNDRAGGPQVHVIYAVPADGEDRFGALVSGLATDVSAIDAWWRTQDAERAPRFDLFEFPGCDSRFGRLDLSFARLLQPGAFYARENQFELVAEALGNPPFEFNDPRKKYLVFYDGVGRPEEEDICGTAFGPPLEGGRFSYAVIFMRAGCQTEIGTGRGNAVVAAHELLHVLGALALGAPHPCPGDDGHPCDDQRDLLWPFLVTSTLDETILDVGRDDYYGHPGPWFDLQDSAWLLLAQRQVELTLAPVGRGVIRDGTGLNCETPCVSEWDAGREVTLNAEPADGFLFRGWTAGCTGLAPDCTLTLAASTTISAVFRLALDLRVAVTGRGSVSGTIPCKRTCVMTLASGDPVALRARPVRGWRFVRWAGACRSSRPVCSFRATKAGAVRAVFARS
jgi:List-Bact-rpt repeat protein